MQLGSEKTVPEGFILKEKEGCPTAVAVGVNADQMHTRDALTFLGSLFHIPTILAACT